MRTQVSGTKPASALAGSSFPWVILLTAGAGSSAVVYKVRHARSGHLAALKVLRPSFGEIARAELALIGELDRRWGPVLLDAGVIPDDATGPLEAGATFVATSWIEGDALDPGRVARPDERPRLAAEIAHGVGRALAELHEAGVRHGDVKPANIVLSHRRPERDAAEDRACTLVDLGLAARIGEGAIRGGTLRYLAPEVRETHDAGPEADLFALGAVLAEILLPGLADLDAAGLSTVADEPARWAEALLAPAPGGRPTASWVASRAARWLGLAADREEDARARIAQVKRAYLGVRAREIAPTSGVADSVGGLPREWLRGALAWRAKLAGGDPRGRATGPSTELRPLGALGRARWLMALSGISAATWPLGAEIGSDEALADRLVSLARTRSPSAWTAADVAGTRSASAGRWADDAEAPVERAARLTRELAQPFPDPAAIEAAEEDAAKDGAPTTIALELARALVRAGELGRAWAALSRSRGGEVEAARAEIARRQGQRDTARHAAERALGGTSTAGRASARATLARLAWDEGRLEDAERGVAADDTPAASEILALVAHKRGEYERGVRVVEEALARNPDVDASMRLESMRGWLEHARGNSTASVAAYARAVELATRAGAVLDEATYLTGAAAAATDAGDASSALASATRAALLWDRLAQREKAARAWLARAVALSLLGARHACDEAAEEAISRARQSSDAASAAYAFMAMAETREPGDASARESAIAADAILREGGRDDRARAAARLLVWASDTIDDARVAETDASMSGATAASRWEWWGARAAAALAGRRVDDGAEILAELAALVGVEAPLGSRGPALVAAARLSLGRGDGESARRFESARRAAAERLVERAPAEYRAVARELPWAREGARDASSDVALAPAQIAQLESIVRSLATRDRLRPLLEQVVDTMVLWSGVERGLLLLRAPDGRLVPRAARNLARHDLRGEQLVLSQGIARRALETGDTVVATDAFASLGDLHASVHALRLRSVLAVPLVARGESLGVVYLDDRARKGAFGPKELAWVRLVASQAAMAIADARDQVLLKRAVRRAERARRALELVVRDKEAELDVTRDELARSRVDGTRHSYDAIIGRSEPMKKLLALVDRVTSSDVPVLIAGESGTGKELVARALHANGGRAKRPFVSENCGSIPESLLESALFGHVKGAFTGASSNRAGLFEAADGGTFFLDEIGEMPLSMQAKLLRVLQDGEVRPVGGERARHVDVRIVGATHRDLEAMVQRGTFRQDLFYRLNVITIRVPSLRERAEDIPGLVAHLLSKHGPGRRLRVTRAAMDRLVAFAWPGNVRQLENEIRRAVVLADENAGRIDVGELSAEVAQAGPESSREAGLDLRSRIDALERDAVQAALVSTRGNQTQAARLLGLSRFGLQKMMKRLKIEARGGAGR